MPRRLVAIDNWYPHLPFHTLAIIAQTALNKPFVPSYPSCSPLDFLLLPSWPKSLDSDQSPALETKKLAHKNRTKLVNAFESRSGAFWRGAAQCSKPPKKQAPTPSPLISPWTVACSMCALFHDCRMGKMLAPLASSWQLLHTSIDTSGQHPSLPCAYCTPEYPWHSRTSQGKGEKRWVPVTAVMSRFDRGSPRWAWPGLTRSNEPIALCRAYRGVRGGYHMCVCRLTKDLPLT